MDIRIIITGTLGIAALAWILVDADKAKILLDTIGTTFAKITTSILPPK